MLIYGFHALYTIPGSTETWEIILNKGVKTGAIDGYQESDDGSVLLAEPMKLDKLNWKPLPIQFGEIKPETGCDLYFMWQKTCIDPHHCQYQRQTEAQIDAAMLYRSLLLGCCSILQWLWKEIIPKLENVTKAIEANPKIYWMWIFKARGFRKKWATKKVLSPGQKESLKLAWSEEWWLHQDQWRISGRRSRNKLTKILPK